MGGEESESKQTDSPLDKSRPPIPWVTLSTTLVATIMTFTTLFMHTWMYDSGTVEINTPELQGKEVEWSVNYGLWDSISHFGEEIEVTDYDCAPNEADCKGFKTAGITSIATIILGMITAGIATSMHLSSKSRAKGSRLPFRLSGISGLLIGITPIIWMTLLPGVFPPIEGMQIGMAFWIGIAGGILGIAGGAFGCFTFKEVGE
ncbi:MAG: hypothetical protein QF807_07585 [Candidatus Thalassarchaeaceae archaeon]|jgi:hypothetical protein|nr:hypothetical protein [Candidatus Thalassarchaeaceae archaeon]MDP7043860.1 hypothetical protein [Candidatus Thalassarchaeaceae archaeon]